ncbi:cysteine hydrolase family protein [Nocardia goodfellowii]|uniref:Nicotinamidase-related amidase n=1 Tax=Nocardia goodfellowii TaxID=882446 RepID=A0ABS4QKF9_9NOCA|nr:hypothetical protein [Nocardia goodfellowii]MBP2192196.1 nicotinamidase-related amidase [Nocardia goodfellowii]
MATALIVGDVQRGITGGYPFTRVVVPPLTELLPRARGAGVLVVFVHFAFRPNGTDLPPGNALVRSFYEAGDAFQQGRSAPRSSMPEQFVY